MEGAAAAAAAAGQGMELQAQQGQEVQQGQQPVNVDSDTNSGGDDRYFVCPIDESRMELTEIEIQRALVIKQAIEEESNGLDNLTDFDYVQLALVDQDNVEAALERVHHFQIFKEEYGIMDDTYQEGLQYITRLVELWPEFILTVSYNQDESNYVLILDIAKISEAALATIQDVKAFLGGAYNMGHMLCPDFMSIRQGYFCVIECDGYDWRNLSMKTRKRLWQEVLAVYPFTARQLKYFHTGLFANLAASLMKKFLPQKVYNKIQVGCQFPAGRLDSFYAVPNRQVANQRLLSRVAKCLQTRHNNKTNFRLPTPRPQPQQPIPPPANEEEQDFDDDDDNDDEEEDDAQ